MERYEDILIEYNTNDSDDIVNDNDKSDENRVRIYKKNKTDRIFWINVPAYGPKYFSFDKEIVFNYWIDYPDTLTTEQKEIFDRENPFWAEFRKR